MKVDALQNLMLVDKNIVKLQAIIDSNEHNAAGITLKLGVGARPTDTMQMNFGIYSDVDGLIEKMMACLLESRDNWAKTLERQTKEATAYLSSVQVTPTKGT